MDDNNKNGAQGSLIHLPASLWSIPDLPFGIICSFLDTSTLMNLCLVCQKFNSYIKNEISLRQWEKRAKNIWSDAVYPILSPANPDKLFWRMSCAALEKQKVLWTQNANPLIRIGDEIDYGKERSYGSSITLRLMDKGKAYIVTARHCDLVYKRIESENEICMKNAHHERIRDLTVLNNEIYSCSIVDDNNPIKSWKLNNGHLQMETSYNFDSSNDKPVSLSSYPGQDVFAVGSDCGYVSIYDTRSKNPMCRYEVRTRKDRVHYRQICGLAINSEYIIAGSLDNIVSVCDQRTTKIMKHITFPKKVTCMKIQQDCVFIGDYDGKLHVLNPKNDFELKSYDIGHSHEIKGVHLTHGNLITSSTHKVVILSPTDPPRHMYTLYYSGTLHHNIRRMEYQNGTLALSSFDDTICIYRLVQ